MKLKLQTKLERTYWVMTNKQMKMYGNSLVYCAKPTNTDLLANLQLIVWNVPFS